MPTDEYYDLIIVGGGPAGASAALYAHRQGLKTLLIEKDKFPRDKICGDALSGKSVAILQELDLLDKVRALPGAFIQTIVFGSPEHTHLRVDLQEHDLQDILTGAVLPMEGFVIRRQIFDHFLFEEARTKVSTCIEEFKVRKLIVEDGQVRGVRGRQGESGEESEYRGRLVLGCDGFNSMVARQSGLYKHESRHLIVGLRCYYEKVAELQDQIELQFVEEVLPGYFWIFPLENGHANIGLGIVHKFLKERRLDLRETLQKVIAKPAFKDRFANARPLGEPVGWNLPIGSKRRRIHGDGFLLLGDAASLIDPFTGEGIGNAFYSARTAVETAVEALQADDFSAHFLKRYDQRLQNALADELKISTRLQQLNRWAPLMNLVIRKAAKNRELSNLICGMLANAVPKKHFINPLFYLKLLLK